MKRQEKFLIKNKVTEEELFEAAKEARKYAYAPYSHFAVGAALLTEDGKITAGCNVENASYPAGNCAERTALFKAVSEGKRNFLALAVAGGPESDRCATPEGKAAARPEDAGSAKGGGGALVLCPPCGICRQALAEFCGASFPILYSTGDGYTVKTLGELLPEAFK